MRLKIIYSQTGIQYYSMNKIDILHKKGELHFD